MGFTTAVLTTTLALGTPLAQGDRAYETAPVPRVMVDSLDAGPDWTAFVPVVASAIVPGSGQLMQGDWGKGLLHLGFGAACLAAIQLGGDQPGGTVKLIGGIGLMGIGFWSPWEAYVTATRPPEASP